MPLVKELVRGEAERGAQGPEHTAVGSRLAASGLYR